MTPEQRDARLLVLKELSDIRDIMRSTYGTQDGKAALAMQLMESTALETNPDAVRPELVAHFATMLYNLGIHKRNYVKLIEAILAVANDDDLDTEKAELAKEETE